MSKALLIICLFFAGVANGQNTTAVLAELQTKLVGHRFLFKNLSGQSVTSYHLAGGQIQVDAPPSFRTIALFASEGVDLNGSIITIRGQRYGLTLDRKTQAIAPTPPSLAAFLRIDLAGETSIPDATEIIEQLFFNDIQSALAIVPEHLKSLVPSNIEVKGSKVALCNPCTRWIRQGSWQEISTNDPGFTIEHVANEVELRMTPAARAAHVHATASFAYTIDESGHTTDLWLLHAAGYGLDQSAANTLKNLRFRPAMYHGAVAATTARSDYSFEQN